MEPPYVGCYGERGMCGRRIEDEDEGEEEDDS
jgi:hypothetical protein